MKLIRGLLIAALTVLVASACGSTATSSTPGLTIGSGGTAGPGAASSAMALLDLPLVDARTGATFTLAGYKGQAVYVENFATWCSNCQHQLTNAQEAAKANGDQAAFVALSVETDLSAKKIAAYAKDQRFDNIRFAVMTPEMLSAMQAAYGTSALNPPSTPHFYVTSSGATGTLSTGFEEATNIQTALADAARS